jgi:hypothetical protein
MSQPSLSQTSEPNPYADVDMYGQNANYMDQVTNGYNQMNLNQVRLRISDLTKNTEYPPYVGVNAPSGQHYDPLTDMYFQPSTNYQPVQPVFISLI